MFATNQLTFDHQSEQKEKKYMKNEKAVWQINCMVEEVVRSWPKPFRCVHF